MLFRMSFNFILFSREMISDAFQNVIVIPAHGHQLI
jgi:hypothetical protein